MLRYTIDRARPGLVAFYDIRPGNRTGLFLQPWNPHGVSGLAGALINHSKIIQHAKIWQTD